MDLSILGSEVDRIYSGEKFFDDLTLKCLQLGVKRFSSDLIRREHCFYGSNGDLFSRAFPFEMPLEVNPTLNAQRLKDAIAAIDQKEISAIRFVKELAESGVCAAHVFFEGKRIIYFGLSGDHYVETWN